MKTRTTEIIVGAFLLIGLVSMLFMLLQLGGSSTRNYKGTTFTLQLPSANGIIAGSKVMMSGVLIGKVLQSPMLTDNNAGAIIQIGISANYRLPKDSIFQIASAGLLGDQVVDVRYGSSKEFIADGDRVLGTIRSGLSDLSSQVSPALSSVNQVVDKLNTDVLNPTTIQDIKESLTSLANTLRSAQGLAGDLNKNVFDEKTLASIQDSIKQINIITHKLDTTVDGANLAVKNLNITLDKINHGDGTISRLLNDPKLASDLSALITNLKVKGVIGYSDTTAKSK